MSQLRFDEHYTDAQTGGMGLNWPRLRAAAVMKRREFNWNQQDLAERAGVSVSTVRRFERAKGVQDLDSISAMTGALHLALTDFEDVTSAVTGERYGSPPVASGGAEVSEDARQRMMRLIAGLKPGQGDRLEAGFQRWFFAAAAKLETDLDSEDDS